MLATALQAEVIAYVEVSPTRSMSTGGGWWCATGRRRAGGGQGVGAVPVRRPRVDDTRIDPATVERQRFCSAIMPAWHSES
jgi:putative transposase